MRRVEPQSRARGGQHKLIGWLKSLFARKRDDYVRIPRHEAATTDTVKPAPKPNGEKVRAIDALEAARKQAEAEKWRRTGVGNLDDQAKNRGTALENEHELIARVARRIEERNFDLPQLAHSVDPQRGPAIRGGL